MSLALHAVLLVLVLLAPAQTLPTRRRPAEVDVVFHRPRPRPRPIEAAPRVVPPPPPAAKPEVPRPAPVEPPRPKPTPPPEIVRREPAPRPAPPPQKPQPPPEPPRTVRTNVFRDDPAPPPAPKPAAPAPRTGAFGAAVPTADPIPRRERPVASAGFGAAVPASAPETAPQRDRAPAQAGFDSPPAAASAAPTRAATASVKQGQFGDTVVVRETRPSREPAAGKPDTPVEIVSKPRPTYTEEARRLKIEGEVVLEVVFVSTGQLRVLGVLQTLGHGLDEAAIAAARSIEFKPARREGKPVDHTARLHILFQLA